jgi:uncharacterized protein YbaR (Trm112 family)
MTRTVECPYCDAPLSVSRKIRLGGKIQCPHCREYLKVVSLKPLRLEYYDDTRVFEEKYENEILEDQIQYSSLDFSSNYDGTYFELPEKSSFDEEDLN